MVLFFVAPELNSTLMFMLSVLILPLAMVFSQLLIPETHFSYTQVLGVLIVCYGVFEEVCTVSLQPPAPSPQDGSRHLVSVMLGRNSHGDDLSAAAAAAAVSITNLYSNGSSTSSNSTAYAGTLCRIDRVDDDTLVTTLLILLYILSLVPLACCYVLQEKMLREKVEDVDVSLG